MIRFEAPKYRGELAFSPRFQVVVYRHVCPAARAILYSEAMRRYSASNSRQQRQDGRQDAMAITATALSTLQQLCSSSPLPIAPLVSAAQAIVTAAQVSDILGDSVCSSRAQDAH
jgi:hypothetical protein